MHHQLCWGGLGTLLFIKIGQGSCCQVHQVRNPPVSYVRLGTLPLVRTGQELCGQLCQVRNLGVSWHRLGILGLVTSGQELCRQLGQVRNLAVSQDRLGTLLFVRIGQESWGQLLEQRSKCSYIRSETLPLVSIGYGLHLRLGQVRNLVVSYIRLGILLLVTSGQESWGQDRLGILGLVTLRQELCCYWRRLGTMPLVRIG